MHYRNITAFKNSNVHRGIYDLAESAENEYQNARINDCRLV